MTPLEIRERLGAKRPSKDRGDVVTGQSLLANESLEEFKDEGYGPIPSSGIPYDRGAGAVGGLGVELAACEQDVLQAAVGAS